MVEMEEAGAGEHFVVRGEFAGEFWEEILGGGGEDSRFPVDEGAVDVEGEEFEVG